MKALLHALDDGRSYLEEAPTPVAGGRVLIETRASLVSAGTERMIVEFAQGNLLSKAMQQPEKVRQVLEKVRTDGLQSTMSAVRSKLSEPLALGYCNAGVVAESRDGSPFAPGTRVVSNGPHAEYVAVPHLLVARIPDGVPFDVAAYTPLASIALQGIRLAEPTLGEAVVVYGLGLVGLLTVQLLRANGCRVIGIDTNSTRLELARSFGAITLDGGQPEIASAVFDLCGGRGTDAVLLTLAGKSDEPAHNAAMMCRKRGRIVLVGVTGLNLRRDDFYAKELSFSVSCSYGPGRYDPEYEERGKDYPLPFVRWTEQRNFEAVLDLMSSGAVDPRPLTSHRFKFESSPEAYRLLTSGEPSLGILLEYAGRAPGPIAKSDRIVQVGKTARTPSKFTVGVIGAGAFANRMLIPALKRAGADLRTIVSSRGAPAAVAATKHGFDRAASDVDAVLSDPAIDTIVVLTRNDSHASLAIRALSAGKNVFVEKPLALTFEELDQLEAAVSPGGPVLTCGFNRRFAPLARSLRKQLEESGGPFALVLTINAGLVPAEHWTQDAVVGGGRIIGEGCHFIDLARYLAGAAITSVNVTAARSRDASPIEDISHISISFANGSTAVVHYLANGSRAFPKERIEAFANGRIWQIDNWRKMRSWGGKSAGGFSTSTDKGHDEEVVALGASVRSGGAPPIPYDELFEVSRWSIRAALAAQASPTR